MADYTITPPAQSHSDDIQEKGSSTTLEYDADGDTFTVLRRRNSGPSLRSAAFPRQGVPGLNTVQLKTAMDLILQHAITLAGGTPV